MNTKNPKLSVGQQLWFVSNRRHTAPNYVTVEKIGRKWAEISNGYRIALDDLTADGGQYTSPGACWLTKEEWDLEKVRNQAWIQLRVAVHSNSSPPDFFTTDEIRSLADRISGKCSTRE